MSTMVRTTSRYILKAHKTRLLSPVKKHTICRSRDRWFHAIRCNSRIRTNQILCSIGQRNPSNPCTSYICTNSSTSSTRISRLSSRTRIEVPVRPRCTRRSRRSTKGTHQAILTTKLNKCQLLLLPSINSRASSNHSQISRIPVLASSKTSALTTGERTSLIAAYTTSLSAKSAATFHITVITIIRSSS